MNPSVARVISFQPLIFFVAAFGLASASARAESQKTPDEVNVTSKDSGDACLAIAAAKAAQWDEVRLRRHETWIFADGHKKWSEAYMTINAVYWRRNNAPWNYRNMTNNERRTRAGSPGLVELSMGLANCRLDGKAGSNTGATAYLFDYGPNRDDSRPSGMMLISNGSGLPLRQELQEPAPLADGRLPAKITVEYSYGGDVKVPLGAERAEFFGRSLGGASSGPASAQPNPGFSSN